VISLVSLAACTISSRIRCTMLLTSCIPPSAVCTRLMPSMAFLLAMSKPRIWARIFSLMARPAASSAALLMR